MLHIPISGSAVFSPTNERFIVAQHGCMGDDFTVSSKVQVYAPNFGSVDLCHSFEVPLALKSVAWSEDDFVAVSAENGEILFTDAELKHQQTVQACEGEITALSYSERIPGILLAVGTQKGEILFFDKESLLYSTKNKNGENPHEAAVTCLGWNSRVPRICASGDAAGRVIVWDQKKMAAIGSFDAGAPVCGCMFSQKVATCVIICCDNGRIVLWDMRRGQECEQVIGRSERTQNIEFIEGYEDHFALRFSSGVQDLYRISNNHIEKIGSDQTNISTCSVFYPNFALQVSEEEIVCKFIARHCAELRPVVYNPLILDSLPENEPEIIEFERCSVSIEGQNQIIYLKSAVNFMPNTYIRDVEGVVGMVQQCIAGEVQLTGFPEYFAAQVVKPRAQLIERYYLDVPETEKIGLKGTDSDGAQAAAKSPNDKPDVPDADIDFFDAQSRSDDKPQKEEEQEIEEENAIQSPLQQHKFSEQVLNFVYNGDIASAVNFLLNQGELLPGLMIAVLMGLSVQETLEFTRAESGDWSDVFNVLDTVRGAAELDIAKFDTRKWREGLRLLNSFDAAKLPLFVKRVLAEQHLSMEQQIDFHLYAGNSLDALKLAWEGATLAHRMSLAMVCTKSGIQVPAAQLSPFRETAELLRGQGETALASEFEEAIGIEALPVSEPAEVEHPIPEERLEKSEEFSPKQQFAMPPLPNMQGPSQTPNVANVSRNPAPVNPSVFVPLPPKLNPQPDASEAPTVDKNVVYATDLLATTRPAPPAATFLPQQPAVMPIPSEQSNAPLFVPNQALQRRVAPPPSVMPPSAASAPIVSPPMTQISAEARPRQIIDKSLQGLMAIDMINCNNSIAAAELIQVLREYQQVDQLAFNKNWAKIAECAIWLADDNGNLLSAPIKSCLEQFALLISQRRGADAENVLKQCVTTHQREAEAELIKWNGALRILAGAFK